MPHSITHWITPRGCPLAISGFHGWMTKEQICPGVDIIPTWAPFSMLHTRMASLSEDAKKRPSGKEAQAVFADTLALQDQLFLP